MDKEYLGARLLSLGFEKWFRYMFQAIEGRPFIVENIHHKLFESFQDVFDGKTNRININIPPRAGKTVMAKYFVIYGLTINPKSNSIYTSYSQELLSGISGEIKNILENPIYKAMYPSNRCLESQVEENPVNDFWKEYLIESTGKPTYTSRKIVTAQGGVILFSSIGSSITGFGVGIRGAKGFTGCMIIDDAQKPQDARSEVMRNNVVRYYDETLLSRLNNPDSPILNIQQRLHLEDLSGYLINTYNFYTIKAPLIVDGVCQIPSQYSESRLKEIQVNAYMFSSQYQQEPIMEGGSLIKIDNFRKYITKPQSFDNLYIVADTAFTDKKMADNSAFLLCGVNGNNLYLLDGYAKKVQFPQLKQDLTDFYKKALYDYELYTPFSSIHIENKGSGISLIQQLREDGLPIKELLPTVSNPILKKEQQKDKYTRFLEIEADIESGYVFIPEERGGWVDEFLLECSGFEGGKQQTKDDMVDCLIYALKVKREKSNIDWDFAKSVFR